MALLDEVFKMALTIEEIGKLIDNDKASEKKKLAKKGLNYYEGLHDIKDYKMYYVDGDGKLQEDKLRSNVKIPHLKKCKN